MQYSANLITEDRARKMSVTLDHIDENAISKRQLMASGLSTKLGNEILSFEIKKIDYVRDIVDLSVIYELPRSEMPQYVDHVGLDQQYDTTAKSAVASSDS